MLAKFGQPDAGDDAAATAAPDALPDRVAGPPNVTQDNIIRRMLGDIDAAANARDAASMLDDLADHAVVSVSLPNLPDGGGEMTVEAYRAHWKATLAEA